MNIIKDFAGILVSDEQNSDIIFPNGTHAIKLDFNNQVGADLFWGDILVFDGIEDITNQVARILFEKSEISATEDHLELVKEWCIKH